MRKLILAIACVALLCAPAFADGFYAPAWSFHSNGGSGSVSTSATGFSLTGNNNSVFGVNTTYGIKAAHAGSVDFTLINFHTDDQDNWSFDPSSIKLNGSPLVTVNGFDNSDHNFTGSVFMSAGDVLTFEIFSTDGCCGPAHINVSGVTSSVPEPGTMALLGTGILGLGFRRFRKN